MSLTLVVGGQYGGEGKGAIVAFLAKSQPIDALVKTGGPNSAHTFGAQGSLQKVRMVPSGSPFTRAPIIFPAGCLIHVPTLFGEIAKLNLRNEIYVHPQAGIVEEEHVRDQVGDTYYQEVGSTLTGTGAASAMRARRRLKLARDEERLRPFLRDTTDYLWAKVSEGGRILVEGAQGFGLSNYHGDYPYVSSRDCTSASALAQIGLGPAVLEETVLVIKCFPTRNSHGRGTLPRELAVQDRPEIREALFEQGGGSFRGGDVARRVALFDFEVVRRALVANTPTALAVTGLDRLAMLQHLRDVSDHYGSPERFILNLETELGLPVRYESWGPFVEDVRLRSLSPEAAEPQS